ncbi:MAG: hypothetical protein ACMXYC_01375 [Candidatus Woesearchaeota archaeon]
MSVLDIRELRIASLEGEKLDPGALFDRAYGDLGELIRQCNNELINNMRDIRMSSRRLGTSDETRQRLKTTWLQDKKAGLGTVDIIRDDNKSEHYKIHVRDNFDMTGFKVPNILFLMGEKDTLVLREARQYSWNFLRKHMYKRLHNDFSEHATQQFYERNVLSELVAPAGAKFMHIPEPQLIQALEEIYNQGIDRITPEAKTIATSHDKSWRIREFLPSISDAPMQESSLIGYFSVLNALGLTGKIDDQVEHISYQQGSLRNFDPDFMLFSKKIPKVMQVNREFAGEILKTKHIEPEYVSKTVCKQTERLRGNGIDPSYFLGYVHSSIKPQNDVELK